MRTYNIDIANLSETNLHYAHTQIKKYYKAWFRKFGQDKK